MTYLAAILALCFLSVVFPILGIALVNRDRLSLACVVLGPICCAIALAVIISQLTSMVLAGQLGDVEDTLQGWSMVAACTTICSVALSVIGLIIWMRKRRTDL